MQYVLRRACLAPDDSTLNSLSIADVNGLLDRLAATDADKKAQVCGLVECTGLALCLSVSADTNVRCA
jgi:hypothetical protein